MYTRTIISHSGTQEKNFKNYGGECGPNMLKAATLMKYSTTVLRLTLQAGLNDEPLHETAKNILLEMGEFYQIQVC